MEVKRIVVLANSIKKGARCVAGREVGFESQLVSGTWIRPVSGESEGELEPRHMRIESGVRLKALEIVDIPFTRYSSDPIHPEDWIVDTKRAWQKVGELDANTLDTFAEQPKNLWLESTSHTERVTGKFLLNQPKHQSLYLIRPADLRIELTCEHNRFKNMDQRKTRVAFVYHGQHYQMSLTDPDFTDRYCMTYPAIGAHATIVRPSFIDNCLLCVSLTPEFNGYHYKVAATVLELP